MNPAGLRRFVSNVLAMAYREATVMRHDKAFMAVVTAQPLVMLLLFGGALSNKPANVPWAVLDHSRTQLSRQLVSEIESTGYFLRPRAVTSQAEGEALLLRGTALAFVVIALGSALCSNFPVSVAIIQWFEKRRARALSALQFGQALGGIFVVAVAWSIQQYGWRTTAFASGVIAIVRSSSHGPGSTVALRI